MQNKRPPADLPEQNPFESPEKMSLLKPIPRPSVLAMMAIALVVFVSGAIAFCCTCLPISLFTFEFFPVNIQSANYGGIDWSIVKIMVPWALGVVVAVSVGFRVRRYLWNRWKQ